MNTIEEKIKSFISENILFKDDGYPYKNEDSFLENGIVDSMNVMEIVAYVEDTYSIKIEDNEIVPANFDSVASISNFIRSKQS